MQIDDTDEGYPLGYTPKVGDVVLIPTEFGIRKLVVKNVQSYINYKGGYKTYYISFTTKEVIFEMRIIEYVSSIFDIPEACIY